MIIKSSELLTILDENTISYLSFSDLNALCIMASLELQLDYESQGISNRGNLC